MTAEELDRLLAETIARHFVGATITDGVIDLGFAGLRMQCRVPDVGPFGRGASASLFMNLWGGALGEHPIFVSLSGYGDDHTSAVVGGGCNWACTFGPVLRAGLGGKPDADAEHFTVASGGRTWDVWTGGLDRVLGTAPLTGEVPEQARRARTRLGGKPWLTGRVLASPWLPLLDPERPTLLSVFVADAPDRRIIEVKVDGCDWPMAARAFGDSPAAPGPESVFLRELAVVVPRGAPGALSRGELERTLKGLTLPIEGGRSAITWPGWAAHRGELRAALSEEEVAHVEADTGPLPGDYRRFLTEVAASGAGPGYGLVSPLDPRARAALPGGFEGGDGLALGDLGGVSLLADAGCGVYYVLVTRGAARGEVWSVPFGSDERYHRVAPSFTRWYVDWLVAMVRNHTPWVHWDARCCSTPAVLARLVEHLKRSGTTSDALTAKLTEQVGPGAIALATGGTPYAAPGAAIAPCQSCVRLTEGFGLSAEVFLLPDQEPTSPTLRATAAAAARGEPLPARGGAADDLPETARGGGTGASTSDATLELEAPKTWWKRLFGR